MKTWLIYPFALLYLSDKCADKVQQKPRFKLDMDEG